MTNSQNDRLPQADALGKRLSVPPPAIRDLRRRILRLAWPICVAIAVGALAQLIIAALLGHMSAEALYIRSVFIPVTFVILAVLEAFDVATQVGFSRIRGTADQGNGDNSRLGSLLTRLLARFILIACAFLAGVALLVTCLAPMLADLLSVPEGASSAFVWFARWTALASVLSAPAAIMAAALRGWGRTGAAAAVSLLVAVVQILTVWLIGQVAGAGVASVPVAILVSGLVGAALGWVFLARFDLVSIRSAQLRVPYLQAIAEQRVRPLIVGIGLPVGLSYLLLSLTSLVIVWLISPFGENVVAGYGAAASIQTVLIVPAIGLAAGTSIVMNQQWGGGDLKLLPRTLGSGLSVAFAIYVVVAVGTFAASVPLSHLLSEGPAVASQTALYLAVVGPSYFGLGVVLYLLTLLEQLGYGPIAVGLNLLYYGIALGYGGVLARSGGGPVALYATIAIANAASLLVLLVISFALVKKRAARHNQPTKGELA